MDASTILSKGGPIMYLLLAMSVLAMTVVLIKLTSFVRMGVRRTDFVDQAFAKVHDKDEAGALAVLADSPSPVARVMETAVRVGNDPTMPPPDSEAEINRVGSAQIHGMESWLRTLSSIAHLSPFCGLLGTVLGMIGAFIQLETAGSRVDPALLSGGIWEALLTTAFGLAVAIPTMAAYFYLEGEVDKVRARMKDVSVRVLVNYRKGRPQGGHEPQTLEDAGRHIDHIEGEGYGV